MSVRAKLAPNVAKKALNHGLVNFGSPLPEIKEHASDRPKTPPPSPSLPVSSAP